MPSTSNLGFAIGGYDWEPAHPTIDPNKPLYQIPRGNAGLLSDSAYDDLTADFAGGLLGRGGFQVSTPAATTGTFQGRQIVPNQPSGVFSAAGENPTNTYDDGSGNGFAGDFTVRQMLERQMQMNTPYRARNYFQDQTVWGDQAARAIGAPDGTRTTRAQEAYDALWSRLGSQGMGYDMLDEVYDPTKQTHADFMKFAMEDQARKIDELRQDSGIYGHGGGDGGDGGQGGSP